MRILIESSKFHDCSREVNGANHGAKSALDSMQYLMIGHNKKDIDIMQTAMEYHAIPDNDENLVKILKKYNIPKEDWQSARKIALILKDADALDRSRFPGNLNEKYLRTDTAKSFIKASCQMQELRGTKYLKEIVKSDYDKKIISKLRDQGFSDYEISFWIKNSPDKIGGIMPIWKSMDNKMRVALKGG